MHYKGFKKFTPSNPLPEGFPLENLDNPYIKDLSQEYHRFLMAGDDLGDGRTILFECDEHGRDWYSLRETFSPNTWKIVYEPGTNKVVSFGKDAIKLFPHGNNVVEVKAIPEGLDGANWRIDPITYEFSKCPTLVAAQNKNKQSGLMNRVVGLFISLQVDDNRSKEDTALMQELKAYIVALRYVDLSVEEPKWPESPL